jgi:hypothetical protein
MKVSSTRGSIVWNGLYRTPGVSRFSVVVFAAVMGCTIAGASFAQDVSSGNRRPPISGLCRFGWLCNDSVVASSDADASRAS